MRYFCPFCEEFAMRLPNMRKIWPSSWIVLTLTLSGCYSGYTGVAVPEASALLSESPWDEALTGPTFDPLVPEEVTAAVGQTAYLTCRVRQLGDRKVSWIRQRDLHILTVGSLSYTNDARFSTVKAAGVDAWTLRIRSTQLRDAGIYECQISSEPKISRAVKLNVVVSRAVILGNPELHIKTGSDVNLTCLAQQMPEPPPYITWYRGGRVINYGGDVGLRAVVINNNAKGDVSQLLIRHASPSDSGNYTCAPAGAEPASVIVHVLNAGDHPAAMQHGVGSAVRSQTSRLIGFLVISLQILLRTTVR